VTRTATQRPTGPVTILHAGTTGRVVEYTAAAGVHGLAPPAA
jgi:hypothetical protein